MRSESGFQGAQPDFAIAVAIVGICLSIGVPNLIRVRREHLRHVCAERIMTIAGQINNSLSPRVIEDCPLGGKFRAIQGRADFLVACPNREGHAGPHEEPPELDWRKGDPDLAAKFPDPSWPRVILALGALAGAALISILLVWAIVVARWRG